MTHADDDYAVYPFRRHLVDATVYVPAEVLLRPSSPPPPAPRRAPRPRRRPGLLRWAAPLAIVAFLAAAAGTAAVTNRAEVQQALDTQLVAPAEAASKPVRRHVARPQLLFVPDVTGLAAARAKRLLKQERFHPRVRLVAGKPGRVLGQRPAAATEVKKTGVVLLLVGAKPKPRPVVHATLQTVIVTSVVGLSRDVAATALKTEGLRVRSYAVPSPQPAGTVVAQSPPTGARARIGSYTRINVAAG